MEKKEKYKTMSVFVITFVFVKKMCNLTLEERASVFLCVFQGQLCNSFCVSFFFIKVQILTIQLLKLLTFGKLVQFLRDMVYDTLVHSPYTHSLAFQGDALSNDCRLHKLLHWENESKIKYMNAKVFFDSYLPTNMFRNESMIVINV